MIVCLFDCYKRLRIPCAADVQGLASWPVYRSHGLACPQNADLPTLLAICHLANRCSDAHALLTHQKGEVDAELETAREALAQAQDALAAAEVGGWGGGSGGVGGAARSCMLRCWWMQP